MKSFFVSIKKKITPQPHYSPKKAIVVARPLHLQLLLQSNLKIGGVKFPSSASEKGKILRASRQEIYVTVRMAAR